MHTGWSLEDQRNNWNNWAEECAYYAVVTDPRYKNGPVTGFWESGQGVAETIKQCVSGLAIRSVAEFGVGVGRVAKHMAALGEFCGWDISDGMLQRFRENCPGLSWHRYDGELPTYAYDLTYSVITLQHIPDTDRHIAIGRMFASSRQAVWMQLPARTAFTPERYDGGMHMHMYGDDPGYVHSIAKACGFRMVSVVEDFSVPPGMESYQYFFLRK